MFKTLLRLLICPACSSKKLVFTSFKTDSHKKTKDGIIYCVTCKEWYPIIDYVLEILPPSQEYVNDKKKFFSIYKKKFLSLKLTYAPKVELQSEQKKQQKHFDWYADNSTQSYNDYALSNFWRSVDADLFRAWKRQISNDSLVLDMGCGQGRCTFQLTDLPIQIVAFDISKNMIRQAVERFRSGTYRATVQFIVADASAFVFQDSVFDYLISYGVLHHLTDPAFSSGEIRRVLKKNTGKFFCLENNRSIFRPIFDILQKIWPQWYEEAGSEPLIKDRNVREWYKNTPVQIKTRTLTYIPPHIINILPYTFSYHLLHMTDVFCSFILWIKDQGGLIEIQGRN